MPECLICLETTRMIWSPNLTCVCMPNIHKKCWEKWLKQGNGTCIICREEQNKIEEQVADPVVNVPILVNHAGIYIINIVVYIVFLIVVIQTIKDHPMFSIQYGGLLGNILV